MDLPALQEPYVVGAAVEVGSGWNAAIEVEVEVDNAHETALEVAIGVAKAVAAIM